MTEPQWSAEKEAVVEGARAVKRRHETTERCLCKTCSAVRALEARERPKPRYAIVYHDEEGPSIWDAQEQRWLIMADAVRLLNSLAAQAEGRKP